MMVRKEYIKYISNALVTDPEYPRCKVNGVSPYDEQIMSMPSILSDSGPKMPEIQQNNSTLVVKQGHYFFFLFNVENYYHFLYDTLPYLYFFQKVKHHHPSCRLLVGSSWKSPLAFQKETLELLGFSESDLEIVEDNCVYEFLHIPSSLTHGMFEDGTRASNSSPSPEAFTIWENLACKAEPWNCPAKIYISRRSWVHGQTDNIGTNYTTRRRCMNEDALVDMLEAHGFQEVFCELLTMSQKIYMFQKATHIVGFIGGGMANLLFSSPKTQVACILTPDFLRINERFRFSMSHTSIEYISGTELAPFEGPYPLYTRVYREGEASRIGEVVEFTEGKCRVQWPEKMVAGFALQASYTETCENPLTLQALDKGLNSPFVCNLESLRKWCESHP